MAVILNKKAFEHAKHLISSGEVQHDAANWESVKATLDEEVRYLNTHTMEEYGLWFLGINTGIAETSRHRYEFPYGDFSIVHRSGLEAIVRRAAQNGHKEIEAAAKQLLELIKQSA